MSACFTRLANRASELVGARAVGDTKRPRSGRRSVVFKLFQFQHEVATKTVQRVALHALQGARGVK